jgi:hypothetical protein
MAAAHTLFTPHGRVQIALLWDEYCWHEAAADDVDLDQCLFSIL